MKQVLLGIVVMLLLLVGGGMWFVFSNLDAIVERAIETAGTEAAGVEVQVDGVEVDLLGGRASVRGFTIANPPGYSNAPMLSFAELAVALDLAGMNGSTETIRIASVSARDPHLLYELRNGTSNLDVLRQSLASDAPPPADDGRPDMRLAIASVVIENIGATVSSDLLPQPAEVPLGDVRLQNLEGTPDEIAQQVLRPLLTQLAANAGRVALTLIPEDLRGAGNAIRDAAGARLEQAGEAAGQAGQRLREGFGNLLNRGGADAQGEAEEEDQ